MKLRALLMLFALAIPSMAQSPLPSAPQPKPASKFDKNFFFAGVAVVSSTALFEYAVQDGARQCKKEDNRAGIGNLFGTADAFGRKPRTALTLLPGASLLAVGTVLHVLHHKKIAFYMLSYGAAAQIGIGAATQWAGCN